MIPRSTDWVITYWRLPWRVQKTLPEQFKWNVAFWFLLLKITEVEQENDMHKNVQEMAIEMNENLTPSFLIISCLGKEIHREGHFNRMQSARWPWPSRAPREGCCTTEGILISLWRVTGVLQAQQWEALHEKGTTGREGAHRRRQRNSSRITRAKTGERWVSGLIEIAHQNWS